MTKDQTNEAERELIDAIISAYHTTRLSETPAAVHILSKDRVRDLLDAYRTRPTDDLAATWRSGIGFGAMILDIVRARFKRTKSPALREFDKALDEAIDQAFNMSRGEGPATYNEAQAAEQRIRAALSKLTGGEG